jgi:hypothetical protein
MRQGLHARTAVERTAAVTPPAPSWFTVALRAVMELGIVVALAVWGYHIGTGTSMRILFGIAAPLVGFGFWGAVDFHQAGRWSELLRLLQELVISGLAALAWYTAGQHLLGWALGLLSIAYHAFVYLKGERLLKRQQPGP